MDGKIREEFVFSLLENVESKLTRVSPGVQYKITKKNEQITIYVDSAEYLKSLEAPPKKKNIDIILDQLKEMLKNKDA